MKADTFISPEGAQELEALRVDGAPKPCGNRAPIRMLARVTSEECGCPEELWCIDGLIYLIHMEADDDTGEIFMFGGDQETEEVARAASLDHLRAIMFQRHAELMQRPEDAALSGSSQGDDPAGQRAPSATGR